MERYFLGNNTAYGFVGYYEDELKRKDKVILLKGGPGTGKSSILKKLANEARARGFDYELWYCSGDPASLDGIYVKQLNAAVVDATAPHASGADLPMMKDFLFDLASSLSVEKLSARKEEIQRLFAAKKQHFVRAYERLRTAKCHMDNMLELERAGLQEADIRAYAAVMASNFKKDGGRRKSAGRKLFTRAISPTGENVYYDHLRDRTIYHIVGSEAATSAFLDELVKLLGFGTILANPLEPALPEGVLLDGAALVTEVGHMAGMVSETVNLGVYDNGTNAEDIDEERKGMLVETAFAVEQLGLARSMHLAAEVHFVSAMDFDRNEKMYRKMLALLFD